MSFLGCQKTVGLVSDCPGMPGQLWHTCHLVCLDDKSDDNASRNDRPHFHQLHQSEMGILDDLFSKVDTAYFPYVMNENHVLSEDRDWNDYGVKNR